MRGANVDDDSLIPRHAREVLIADRRCIATNRDGERCGRAAAIGGFVCNLHGAKSPNAERARRERLFAMVDPALDALLRCLKFAPACDKCGRSDADRDPTVIRAAQVVLDRAGFGPHATITVTPSVDKDWMRFLTDDQFAQMRIWIDDAKARMKAATGESMVIDAEDVQESATD
jgi:hypothetical protein